MTSHLLRLTLSFALFGAFASLQVRAAVIEPPSEFLFKSHHVIVAAEVVGISEQGVLTLRVRETLHGRVPGVEVAARTSPAWLGDFKPGQRVLAAYTEYRRSATRPKTLEPRRDGAALLVSAGLEPALFHDSPGARALLRKPDETALSNDARLRAALAALESGDRQQQNFQASELALREGLHGLIRARERQAIAAAVDSKNVHPSARATLLAAAAANPEAFGDEWPEDAARRVIAGTPVAEADEALSPLPNLVRVAFDVLDRQQARIGLAHAQQWIVSTHSGLAESALLAIRRSAPEREREATVQALANSSLAAANREFLRDHLRRLDIMRDTLDAARVIDGDSG